MRPLQSAASSCVAPSDAMLIVVELRGELFVQQANSSNSNPCRSVTAEEIAHYKERGWVKLKRFVDPETIDLLLKVARQRMGDDGDSSEGISQPYFTVGYSGGLTNPPIRRLMDQVGENAKALMDRKTWGGRPIFLGFFRTEAACREEDQECRQRRHQFPSGLHYFRGRSLRRNDLLDALGGLWSGSGDDVVRQWLAPLRRVRQLPQL